MHDNSCPRCQDCSESTVHIARDCTFAMQVWSKLNCRWPSYVADLNFNEWLNWLFVNSASNTKEEIAITIWAIWFARNKLLHERETQSVKEVITFIRGYASAYELGQSEVDVGFSEANNRVAPGFLIRNDDSNLMGLRFRMHNLVRTVVLAEAMAVLHGLQFESHLGSDSGFASCRFEFVAREGNTTMHEICVRRNETLGRFLLGKGCSASGLGTVDLDRCFHQPS
ncbi:hypothetical protein Goklo_006313 [Gossypium klotzschianum]|uniref:Reverse transcriptase zinc-binding domain-containing protein n=1 Tax=Gossypium klotzschianum TaxID=34286 RepID=A0A7J8VH40_9ROSI|nr:hypothetical protein [Gossypium klotzschianum]